ncbi:ACP S-malonyltransferase [Streptomyces sp. TS71-3]|uniref:ACP S-malonyltransferase n=1 Tax=Streptomyces sp. TS71-3 TaxID=2733862 RepID=UPI001AFD4D6B|nr:ACP S-malonyltransferase [Streptomyces sp. TS71-3]GHJ35628.1 hypothetical protein Sm713_12370 [Streptomyces sp. TS71-3]
MRAYVFPGQGSQKRGMGKGLFEEFPDLCREADDVLGYAVTTLCLENPERLLNRTEYAQPAIYVVNALHYLTARRQGLPPADYLAGHSLGEYSALLTAGAFDFATGLAVVKRRAELMGKADGGGMAAVVGLSETAIEEALRAHGATGVVIANHNAPRQFVLSGGKDELERIRPVFERMEGVRGFVPLRVSGAFHSPRMESAADEFRGFLDSVDFGELGTPVVSNVTGRPFGSGAGAVREALADQITRPVRWAACVRYMREAGVSDFVEIGSGRVLTSLIEKITAEEQHAGDEQEARGEAPATTVNVARGAGADELDAGDAARRELIARIKREILHPEIGDAALGFADDESFRRLGLDSIVYVRLARKVQEVFGIPFKPDRIYAHRTCSALADYLLAERGGAGTEADAAAPREIRPTETARQGTERKGAEPPRTGPRETEPEHTEPEHTEPREREQEHTERKPTEPDEAPPWREYRDERVLAVLRDCANGTLSVERAIATIRAGGAARR